MVSEGGRRGQALIVLRHLRVNHRPPRRSNHRISHDRDGGDNCPFRSHRRRADHGTRPCVITPTPQERATEKRIKRWPAIAVVLVVAATGVLTAASPAAAAA